MSDKKETIEPIDATFDEVLTAVAPKASPIHVSSDDSVVHETELVEYTDPGNIDPITFRLDPGTETIWATQAQIADLFATKQPNVSTHLKNIFDAYVIIT